MELDTLRAMSKAESARAKNTTERKRNLAVLILRHLVNAGWLDSYHVLARETKVTLECYDAADNVDLMDILQEYEESYAAKFNRKPKLVRSVAGVDRPKAPNPRIAYSADGAPIVLPPLAGAALDRMHSMAAPLARQRATSGGPLTGVGLARERRARAASAAANQTEAPVKSAVNASTKDVPERASLNKARNLSRLSSGAAKSQGNGLSGNSDSALDLALEGQHLSQARAQSPDSDPDAFFDRQMAPTVPPHLIGEYRSLAENIASSVLSTNPNVRWDSIAGLNSAKKLLKEAVVHPVRYPQYFTGLLTPWKGILLFGPPGTGKTMLAKAVATECRTTFFNISASIIISKWRGDSEKLVRTLFDMARHHAPSTIFIDELDSLMMARGGEGEHEASRRMKTELLVQMDGLARSEELVFVLAATNLPWELDQAMLRRLEKRILVDLPCLEARTDILTAALSDRISQEVQLCKVAGEMAGYSGSDVMLVAKEAAMRPLRRLMAALESPQSGTEQSEPQTSAIQPVLVQDIRAAMLAVKPCAHLHKDAYHKFSLEFGSNLS